jgi:hypothetical protein
MTNLDDFDIDPMTEDEQLRPGDSGAPRAIDEESSGGLSFRLILGILAVLVVGTLGGLWYFLRAPVVETPTRLVGEPVATFPPAVAASAPATPPMALPSIDESDTLVRQMTGALSSHPELSRWLGQSSLVRTVTAVVVNISDGESPAPHLAFLAPKARLGTISRGGRLVADGATFEGHTRVADVVVSLDQRRTAEAFATLEPLFESAYRDLGHPEGGFRRALVRAMMILEATPVPAQDEALLRNGTVLRYADPRFEGLSRAQKQFLRMGPANVRRIQEALAKLRPQLEGPRG